MAQRISDLNVRKNIIVGAAGDVSPSSTLDVRGDAKIWFGGTGYYATFHNNNEFNVYTSGGTSSTMYLNYRGGDVVIGGNQVFFQRSTGRLGINTTSPSYHLQADGDIYANGGWFRVSGNQGLYFQSHGGGWHMTDSTYIRNYGSKQVLLDNTLNIGGGYIEKYGTDSMNLRRVNSITFAPNNSWNDATYHGIMSTDYTGTAADSISINSYNDITLRLDANSNNSASYLRIMNNTTGNSVGSWFGYNGSGWVNRLWGNVGINAEPRTDSYVLNVGGRVHMNNNDIHYTNELHFNSGTRFQNNSSQYAYFRSDSTTAGGIMLRDGSNNLKGYGMYWDSSGNGVLNSNGSWAFRAYVGNSHASMYYAGSEKLKTESYGARTFGSHRVNDNLYLDVNYGSSLVGAYSATRYQGIFAMGDAYKLSLDGTSPGTLYGLAWTHQNIGGESISGLGHQMLVMSNGDTRSAMGDGIWTKYNVYGNAFFDQQDNNYYLDPNATSRIRKTNLIALGSAWDDGLNLYSSDGSNRWNLLVDNGNADNLRFAHNNAERVRFEAGGPVRIFNTLYAPALVDSDNNGYYLNPAGTSNLYYIQMPHLGNGSPNLAVNNGGQENWRAINIIGGSNEHGIGYSATNHSVLGRNNLSLHVSSNDSIRFHSSGWDTLFEVAGSTGQAWFKGNVGLNTTSPSGKLHVVGDTAGSDVLAVDGVNGRLFTVTDDLTDSLFSVNTIAGLPIIEAFADQSIKLGPFTAPVEVTTTGELKVNGGTNLGTAVVGATVSNDTITFTRANGGTFAVTTSDANTNYYLDDITKSGNTLTFVMNGKTDVTYEFGSLAFDSTTLGTAASAATGDFAAASHTHSLADITDAGTAAGAAIGDFATAAQGALADSALQSLPSHNHDSRYYTETEVNNLLTLYQRHPDQIVANLLDPEAISGTWTTGDQDDWGSPRIGSSQARYNDGTGYIQFTIPAGIDTAYLSQLTWDSGGYVDVYGVQSDGGLVFLRRINTKQNVENSNEGANGGNPNQHDGSTVTLAATGLSAFASIRLQNRSGRFHLTGLGFTSAKLQGAEGTGMIHPAQLCTTSGLNADTVDGVHASSFMQLNAGSIYTSTGNSHSKIKLWGNDSNYSIGMHSGMTVGMVNDYAMTFQMNNDADRGWVWRNSSQGANAGVASLTATGDFTAQTIATVDGLAVGTVISGYTFNSTFAPDTPTGFSINMADGGATLGQVQCSLLASSGDVTAFSDRRLKENIKPIEGALDKVLKLQGVSYTRIDTEDKKTKIGFIAQEVKEVVPEVVSIQNREGVDIEDVHTVSYANMVALLTEAVKEQQKQIDELKAKLDGLTK